MVLIVLKFRSDFFRRLFIFFGFWFPCWFGLFWFWFGLCFNFRFLFPLFEFSWSRCTFSDLRFYIFDFNFNFLKNIICQELTLILFLRSIFDSLAVFATLASHFLMFFLFQGISNENFCRFSGSSYSFDLLNFFDKEKFTPRAGSSWYLT